ncbi:MAG: LysR family transcriptional regulator [Myxococcales bacterium]|nr:LysR family transcriptional regulator [Myxococcales bacterium]
MELTPLKYFSAIARLGSITAASRELRISQPALTVAIQRLEDELQTPLLFRNRRGVSLTDPGRLLLRAIDNILDTLEETTVEMRSLLSEPVGQLTLACPDVLASYFLPTFLGDFLRSYPLIGTTLRTFPSPQVQDEVLARQADFGLAVNPTPHPDLVLRPLFSDETAVMSLETIGDPEKAESRLREWPLIYVPHLPQSRSLLNELERVAELPKRRLECGDLELVKSLVASGVGNGILPQRVAQYAYSTRLVPLHSKFPVIPDTICLIFRADMLKTRALSLLKETIVGASESFAE